LQAEPLRRLVETAWIDITQITWKITPLWDPKLAKRVPATLNPPTASASISLPVPTGDVKSVNVEMSGKWAADGGHVTGYVVDKGRVETVSACPDYRGSNVSVAWTLNFNWVVSPASSDKEFWVQPTQCNITYK
jgi:hypothetical protein